MNVQYLQKSLKLQYKDQRAINDKFVLAALSIPLNNRLSNFERINFNYMPNSLKDFDEASLVAREELLATARMLEVEGQPSRSSLIHYINIENIHANTSQHVSELFYLIENEKSPFVISKKGKAALDALCKECPSLTVYKEFIAKTLTVRILQKCKSFYKSMKLSKLMKVISFYDSIPVIENLLYECNREGLVHTVINYHSQGEGYLIFNPEDQVADNLTAFGSQLKECF